MPILKITQEEYAQIESDPLEFVNMSVDISDEMSSGNLKAIAAQLILDLQKNVDGMLTFMIDFCLTFLEKIVQYNCKEDNQNYLNNIIDKFRLKFLNEEEIVEVNLLILSILKDAIAHRIDLQITVDRKMVYLIPIFLDLK
jgi:hypothetical protein